MLNEDHAFLTSGSGYVLDTLYVAKLALEQTNSYAEAIRYAIAFGNDTDTSAAVTGGIAGVRYGVGGIPEEWRRGLRGQALVQPLLERLRFERTGEGQPFTPLAPPIAPSSRGISQWMTRWLQVFRKASTR